MGKTGPLDGLIVIDLSRVLAGPYATMVLADLGARVIKVEVPQVGDDARHFGPFVNEKSAYFASLNRGKESIALNLKDSADREIFESLLGKGDVLVENFRPGTMEKLGYGWKSLHALNPRLIYCAVSGFGHTGPYRHRPAYDMVVQAMGGIMSVTGQESSTAPTRVGTSVGDITAGLFGATGILAALQDRERTGRGMMVDVGMLDCQVAILENAVSRYLARGEIPGPLGARHPSITPFEAFHTRDDYVIIAAGNNALFEKLCAAMNRSDLSQDPEFLSNDLRTQNHTRLKQELEKTLVDKNAAEWLDILSAAGVPCGPINNIEQVVNDPHIAARNMIIRTQDAIAGEVRMAGNPIKLSGYPDAGERRPAPDLDADRQRIFTSLGIAPQKSAARD
jgi:CoA:oxalate CoA-transferase